MISFVIPCFNRAREVVRVMESFLWQTESMDYEVILVDNNSTHDNLQSIYEYYFGRIPIYLIHQPQLKTTYSLCRARNIGMSLAQYPWIATLDSDCILNENYFRVCKHLLHQDEPMMMTGERKFIDPSPLKDINPDVLSTLPQVASKSNYGLLFDRRLIFVKDLDQQPHPWAYMHGGNCIFRKEDALRIHGADEAYDGFWGYEDIDFAFRLKQAIPELSMSFNRDLYVYHQEDTQLSDIDEHRINKEDNPNWIRISEIIPGYQAFKQEEYKTIKELIKAEAP